MMYLVGFILVSWGIIFAMGAIRLLADFFMILLFLAAWFFIGKGIYEGTISSWLQLTKDALFVGGLAGLFSLPILPYSTIWKKFNAEVDKQFAEIMKK